MNDSSTSAPFLAASLQNSSVRHFHGLRAKPPVVDPNYVQGLVVGASVGVLSRPLEPPFVVPPPVSNTGGKSIEEVKEEGFSSEWQALTEEIASVDFSEWQALPVESDQVARIDTLTFSFSGLRFGGDAGAVRAWVLRWSGGLLTIGGNVQRFNGYRQCLQIVLASRGESPALGWLGMSDSSDPMRGRWCLHFTGAACEYLKSGNWVRLFADVSAYEVKITRVDLAVDELEGGHSVDYMRQQYVEGLFNLNGRPPKFQFIQSSDGNTFYVGKRGSGKICRSYEKGCQLGDNSSPWVRHEVELRSSGRVIPLEVLVNPTVYFKGAYPRVFDWISGGSQMIKTFQEKHRIEFESAVLYAKRQVGRLVRYCQDVIGYAPEQIIEDLIADPGRYPDRLFLVDDESLTLAWG